MGISDYRNSRTNTVLLKIETGTDDDYFLNFNRMAGINSGTREGANQVLVTKQGMNGMGYSVSSLVAKLTSGRSYTISSFGRSGRPVRIQVDRINMNSSPAYADVSVEMGCSSDSHCQRDAMFACNSYCNRNTNTCEMKSGCNCDYTCNSRTEDLFECPSDCLDPRSLETTRSGNNAHSGNMFEIRAKNEVQITSFDIDAAQDRGTLINAYVYTKVGGYEGFQRNPAEWTHIQTVKIESRGENELTKLPNLPRPIVIPAGRRQSFYVTLDTDGMQYTGGQSEGRLYASDDNLEFFEGVGVAYPFSTTSSPRIFNGSIMYIEVPSAQLAGASTVQGSTRPTAVQTPSVQQVADKQTVTNKERRRQRRRERRRRFRRGNYY